MFFFQFLVVDFLYVFFNMLLVPRAAMSIFMILYVFKCFFQWFNCFSVQITTANSPKFIRYATETELKTRTPGNNTNCPKQRTKQPTRKHRIFPYLYISNQSPSQKIFRLIYLTPDPEAAAPRHIYLTLTPHFSFCEKTYLYI